MNKRAAIYIRQSQTHENTISPELQEQHCREVCQREGFAVSKVYSDIDISGRSTTNRPGLLAMVKDYKTGKFDVAIADDYSRFARNMSDGADIIGAIPVGTYSEGIPEDTSDDFAPLLYLLLAHKFSSDMGKRWKATHAHRLARGLAPNGRLPYGYIPSKEGEPPVINPELAPIIRNLFKRYTAGTGAKTLCNDLRADGNTDRVWTTTGIYRILDNPFYVGKIVWAEEEFPGKHEALLTEAEWAAYLRERNKRKLQGKRKPKTSIWPYSGLVKCGKCGSLMVHFAKGNALTCSGYSNKGKNFCSGTWRKASRTMFGIHIWIQEHNAEMSALVPSTDTERRNAQEAVEKFRGELKLAQERITKLQLMAVKLDWDEATILDAISELHTEKSQAEQNLNNALADLGSIPEPNDNFWAKMDAIGGSEDQHGNPTYTLEGVQQLRAYVSKFLKEVRVLPLPRGHKPTHLWEGLEFVKVGDVDARRLGLD